MRLLFYGTTLLGFNEFDVWHMPVGKLLDLSACYRQFNGMEKPYSDPFEDLNLQDIAGI